MLGLLNLWVHNLNSMNIWKKCICTEHVEASLLLFPKQYSVTTVYIVPAIMSHPEMIQSTWEDVRRLSANLAPLAIRDSSIL